MTTYSNYNKNQISRATGVKGFLPIEHEVVKNVMSKGSIKIKEKKGVIAIQNRGEIEWM